MNFVNVKLQNVLVQRRTTKVLLSQCVPLLEVRFSNTSPTTPIIKVEMLIGILEKYKLGKYYETVRMIDMMVKT